MPGSYRSASPSAETALPAWSFGTNVTQSLRRLVLAFKMTMYAFEQCANGLAHPFAVGCLLSSVYGVNVGRIVTRWVQGSPPLCRLM